jgi:hypothetical protein
MQNAVSEHFGNSRASQNGTPAIPQNALFAAISLISGGPIFT